MHLLFHVNWVTWAGTTLSPVSPSLENKQIVVFPVHAQFGLTLHLPIVLKFMSVQLPGFLQG